MRKPAKKTSVYSVGSQKPKIEMQNDNLGKTSNGLTVTAATDAAGPQVIVIGPNLKRPETHLLSKPLKDHQAAITLGKKVVKDGIESYKDWYDLKKGGTGLNLFAIFGAEFRGGNFDTR